MKVGGQEPGWLLQLPVLAGRSSASVYYTERKPKNKKWGRPGNEATSFVSLLEFNDITHNIFLSQITSLYFKALVNYSNY